MLISQIIHPFLNNRCRQNVVRPSSQTISLPDHENLPVPRPHIQLRYPSKNVSKNYIYSLDEKKTVSKV